MELGDLSPTGPPHLVLHGSVDLIDQPGEGVPVDGFSQSISGIEGVVNRERAEDLRGESPVTDKFHITEACLSLNAPDQSWLRSFGTSALPGDCEHPLQGAAGEKEVKGIKIS